MTIYKFFTFKFQGFPQYIELHFCELHDFQLLFNVSKPCQGFNRIAIYYYEVIEINITAKSVIFIWWFYWAFCTQSISVHKYFKSCQVGLGSTQDNVRYSVDWLVGQSQRV